MPRGRESRETDKGPEIGKGLDPNGQAAPELVSDRWKLTRVV